MKKILLSFFLFITIFAIQSQSPINAATTCMKATGNNVYCSGYLKCPVGMDIYCCDLNAQDECNALQKPVTPTCSNSHPGAMCHLTSDNCSTNYGQLGCPQFQICGTDCSGSTTPILNTVPTVPQGNVGGSGTADIHGTCGVDAISTAIGCIPILGANGTTDFLSFTLRWAVGIGGGIAFLLIIYAGFMIMTASGNPERLKAGQELLTSAISGLILLIFSVFILKFIGIDILGLGAFGFGK